LEVRQDVRDSVALVVLADVVVAEALVVVLVAADLAEVLVVEASVVHA
jgi:hypothetical protein